jgi:hypothetical protein
MRCSCHQIVGQWVISVAVLYCVYLVVWIGIVIGSITMFCSHHFLIGPLLSAWDIFNFLHPFTYKRCRSLPMRFFLNFRFLAHTNTHTEHALISKLTHYTLIHISLLIIHLTPNQSAPNHYNNPINRFV